jgi:hypothetical protein
MTAIVRGTICPHTKARTCRNSRETTQCSGWILILKHNQISKYKGSAAGLDGDVIGA